jgi:hypothetical protein
MKKIYISGPYSADNVMGVLRNIRKGIDASIEVFKAGFAPFCPWLDYHYVLADKENKLALEDFYNYSLAWLDASDAILMIGNWQKSKGCIKEYNFAKDHEILVFTSLESLIEYFDGHN